MLEFVPLPITWLLFFLLGRVPSERSLSLRRSVLTAASLTVLYAFVGPLTFSFYTTLGLAIILLGLWLRATDKAVLRTALFVISLVMVVTMIIVFLQFRPYIQKYFVSVPSLSYLGFRGIAYLVSAYRGCPISVSSGLMQMFFLPVLFMGPITRLEDYQEERQDYRGALRRLALGFPMLIGGHLIGGYVLERIHNVSGIAWWEFWLGAVANSFQFYFTFAGYSHLIIGLGLIAGFKLPENFNNPYFAQSIGDFWRRWHMSLSFWIRDYLYFPLGGNRKGLVRKCANLLFAMGICGVWHGLEWHYLLWGLFHGALLAVESIMGHYGWRPLERLCGRLYAPVKITIVFLLVTFGWLLFKYPIRDLVPYLKGLIP